jgi:hypothetical protein
MLAFLGANGKQSGEIVVDAHPESIQLEKNGTRVFVNVPDTKEVQVAEVVKGTILAHWPTTVATTCFLMAARRSASTAIRRMPQADTLLSA